ncbi:MAG: DegT/DnrJ/EryC1/StrS family aminotransferase [Candidatus Dormibacteria bacterium]
MTTLTVGEQEALAIDGGPRLITEPLGREWPGTHFIDADERRLVIEALERRHGLTDDLPPVARQFFSARWAASVNSGTGGLFAAIKALDIGPGMEVLVPGICWIPTITCVVAHGAIPVLVEVGEDLGMDPADMERKITRRTKAVIVVHMLGAAANVAPLMEVARRHKLRVIEDCAQDSGGKYNGKFVGLFGDIGVFSLQYNKHATGYVGGFMISNDKGLGARAEIARDAGLTRIMHKVTYVPGDDVMWGEGRLLSPLVQAMAAAQIPKLPKIIESMQRAQQRIKEGLAGIEGIRFRPHATADSLSGSFMVTYWPTEETARKAADALRAEGVPEWTHHIATYGTHIYSQMPMLTRKVGYVPGSSWPWDAPENAQSQYSYEKGALPKSDEIFSRGVLMAVPSNLTDSQCDQIAAAYRKVIHHLLPNSVQAAPEHAS